MSEIREAVRERYASKARGFGGESLEAAASAAIPIAVPRSPGKRRPSAVVSPKSRAS